MYLTLDCVLCVHAYMCCVCACVCQLLNNEPIAAYHAWSVVSTLVLTYTNDSCEEVEAVTTLLEYITELEAIGVTVLVGTDLMTFVTTLLDPSVGVTVLVVVVMATLVIMVTLDVTLIVGGPTVVVATVVTSSSTRLTTSVVGEGCVVCATLAPRDVVCMVDR